MTEPATIFGIEVGPARFSGIALPGAGEKKGKDRHVQPCPAPVGVSSFAFFFAPILYELGVYWWDVLPIYGNTYERAKADESLKMHWVELPPGAPVPPFTYIPYFAKYIEDWDWCRFHGFTEEPGDDLKRWEKAQPPGRPLDVSKMFAFVDIRFVNVDGAFWQMQTKEESFVTRVRQHVLKIKGAWTRDMANT